jgi:hypothetical protein
MVNTAIPGWPWVGSVGSDVGLSMVLWDVQAVVQPAGMP